MYQLSANGQQEYVNTQLSIDNHSLPIISY